MNTELNKVHEWLCTNKLSINLSKANYMIFSKTMTMVNLNKQLLDCSKRKFYAYIYIDSRLK